MKAELAISKDSQFVKYNSIHYCAEGCAVMD